MGRYAKWGCGLRTFLLFFLCPLVEGQSLSAPDGSPLCTCGGLYSGSLPALNKETPGVSLPGHTRLTKAICHWLRRSTSQSTGTPANPERNSHRTSVYSHHQLSSFVTLSKDLTAQGPGSTLLAHLRLTQWDIKGGGAYMRVYRIPLCPLQTPTYTLLRGG